MYPRVTVKVDILQKFNFHKFQESTYNHEFNHSQKYTLCVGLWNKTSNWEFRYDVTWLKMDKTWKYMYLKITTFTGYRHYLSHTNSIISLFWTCVPWVIHILFCDHVLLILSFPFITHRLYLCTYQYITFKRFTRNVELAWWNITAL